MLEQMIFTLRGRRDALIGRSGARVECQIRAVPWIGAHVASKHGIHSYASHVLLSSLFVDWQHWTGSSCLPWLLLVAWDLHQCFHWNKPGFINETDKLGDRRSGCIGRSGAGSCFYPRSGRRFPTPSVPNSDLLAHVLHLLLLFLLARTVSAHHL